MAQGLIADSVARIFSDHADPQTLILAGDDSWRAPLWDALEDNGLPLAWVPDHLGGIGLSLAEGFEIIETAGRFALPVPLVETMLGAWLLGAAEISPPSGPIIPVPARPRDHITKKENGRLGGTAHAVPFADETMHLAVPLDDGQTVALVAPGECRFESSYTLAGDSRAKVTFDGVAPLATGTLCAGTPSLYYMGAAMRSLQIAGALQQILVRTVEYANDRVAFGKTIGRFQAVQNNIARLAGETAAAAAAAGSAVDALAAVQIPANELLLEIAAAKVRCADAATTGVAIAHQVHGAIGLTTEHVLHRFSLRALAWREDFGNESHWAALLGRSFATAGPDNLWAHLTTR